jgi:NAD(P)-dependent dehydrogenase (short-subunit alcohol dehydrogenase family)
MSLPDQRGRRVIVVGAASAPTVARDLVSAGAEVHSLDVRKPDIAWLASHTDCALDDAAAIVAAVERIGAVLHAVHLMTPLGPACRAALIETARGFAVGDGLDVFDALDPAP